MVHIFRRSLSLIGITTASIILRVIAIGIQIRIKMLESIWIRKGNNIDTRIWVRNTTLNTGIKKQVIKTFGHLPSLLLPALEHNEAFF